MRSVRDVIECLANTVHTDQQGNAKKFLHEMCISIPANARIAFARLLHSLMQDIGEHDEEQVAMACSLTLISIETEEQFQNFLNLAQGIKDFT